MAIFWWKWRVLNTVFIRFFIWRDRWILLVFKESIWFYYNWLIFWMERNIWVQLQHRLIRFRYWAQPHHLDFWSRLFCTLWKDHQRQALLHHYRPLRYAYRSLQPRRRADMGTRARPLNHLARAARTKREF